MAEFGAGGGQNWTFEDGVKLNGGTASRVLLTDASKNIAYSTLTSADLEAIPTTYLKLDQTTPQTLTATDTTITASDEIYFGDATDSFKLKKDTIQGILDLTPAPDLSGYVPYTGATGDVDLGANDLMVDTDTLFVNSINHRVGIGTKDPSKLLEVRGQSKFISETFPVIDIFRDTKTTTGYIYGGASLERLMTGGTATNGTGIGFFFKAPNSTGTSQFAGMFGGALSTVTDGAEVGDIVFAASWLGASPYRSQHLIIRATGTTTGNVLIPNGQVGIGTTTPTEKLDVNGSIKFNGGLLESGALDSVIIKENAGNYIFRGLNYDNYWVDNFANSTAFQVGESGGGTVFTGFSSSVVPRTIINTEHFQISPKIFNSAGKWPVPVGEFEILDASNNMVFTVKSGDVGVGTSAPSARLHAISTTEQLRLGYDTSNYWNATTGSTGITTFNAVGTTPSFVFSDGISLPYVAKTANYILTSSDYTVNCSVNSFTVTLPTAVGITGRIYNIKNSGTGVITVACAGAETIDGITTQTLNQYDSIKVQSTNAGWIIL